jgi:hypothetical protein
MKKILFLLSFILVSAGFNSATAQDVTDSTLYKVEKNDGTVYIGYIVKQDAREVLLRTQDLGDLYIPKHEIKAMEAMDEAKVIRDGDSYSLDKPYNSRYYFSTTGLPIGKGQQYVVFNWYGPEYHTGLDDHIDVGVMTSWIGMPILLSAKYSIPIGTEKKVHLGLGTLLGTISWIRPASVGGLPYAALTFGDQKSNVTFSGGMAFWSDPDWDEPVNQPMVSLSSKLAVTEKVSFVFESLIFLPQNDDNGTISILTPGMRFDTGGTSAFQFAFSALSIEGELLPLPFPTLSWFRSF